MSAVPTLRRIALAAGDPNGIGPEIALKALAALAPVQRDRITVFGPGAVLQRAATACDLSALWPQIRHVEAGTLPDSAAVPGRIDAAAGASTVASATAALQAVRAGDFDVVIACPHHETAIHQAGIAFSGYPSLVARVCGMPEDTVFLLLVGGGLRIVHVTLHESVRTALDRLTPTLVQQAVRAGVRACAMLGVHDPSIGVFGINPHASEGTLFGPEDQQIVVPAMTTLRARLTVNTWPKPSPRPSVTGSRAAAGEVTCQAGGQGLHLGYMGRYVQVRKDRRAFWPSNAGWLKATVEKP